MRDQSEFPASSSGTPDLVGKTVGRYRILGPLGMGGMGTVYMAEHMTLGRKTAVKILNPAMARDPDALARFRREARNACTIEHPNVCAVYDFGDTPEGLTFLAMEFIDGKPLSAVIDEAGGRLPLDRAARILRATAEGLDAAHARGIVHRDLKPANIMITRAPGGRDGVKVVDFGIAKAAAGGEGQDVTRVGLVAGTPQYMSPEHISGDEPDLRSDVYSLAVVFFRAVTGQLPFQANTQVELLRKILTESPAQLREACADLQCPGELQEVLDRALSRDPSGRPRSASELAREVEVALAGAPTSVAEVMAADAPQRAREPRRAPSPVPEEGVHGVSRRLSLWLVGSALGAAVLAVTAYLIFSSVGGRGLPGAAAAISLAPDAVQLSPGGAIQLVTTVTDADRRVLADAAPVWVSEDLRIAAVGPAGLVTGVSQGSTRVSARVGDAVGWATISVVDASQLSLAVEPNSVRLSPGESVVLRATATDAEGVRDEAVKVDWSSDRPQVASVDAYGAVTARAEGTATIRAASAGTSSTAVVRVAATAPRETPGTVDAREAPTILARMLTLGDSAPPATLSEARRQAEAFWNLGDQLESRYRALAAYLVGWTSTLLSDRSSETVELWLQRAVDLDPRDSYRQALAEHRRRAP